MTAQGTGTVLPRDAMGCLDGHQNQTRFCCRLDDEAAYALGAQWSGRLHCQAARHLPTRCTVRLPQAALICLARTVPLNVPDLGICCRGEIGLSSTIRSSTFCNVLQYSFFHPDALLPLLGPPAVFWCNLDACPAESIPGPHLQAAAWHAATFAVARGGLPPAMSRLPRALKWLFDSPRIFRRMPSGTSTLHMPGGQTVILHKVKFDKRRSVAKRIK